MRDADGTSGSPFSPADLEARVPVRHPLRQIRQMVKDALASLIPILFPVRSERQLMEQMQHDLLFRRLVGLGIDDPVRGEGRTEICPVDRFQP